MLIYDAAKTSGGLLLLAGILSLVSHLASQFRIGSAPWETLVGGGAALTFGVLLCLLGDIGRRVVQLETQLTTGGKVDPNIQGENDILS